MNEKNAKEESAVPDNVQRASAIFFTYGGFIRTIIRRKIRDENEVEDIFQDFFISLVSKPVPPEVKDLRGYIYKAVINDIADRTRRVKRYQAMTYRSADFNKLIVNNPPPEDALIEKEHIDRMIGLVKRRVTKKEFKAIASRYRDNLSMKEAADSMNISNRSVARYVSTGFSKVRKFLALNKQEVEDDSTQ